MIRPSRRVAWVVAVVLVAALGVLAFAALGRPSSTAAATGVNPTAQQESRYVAEIKEFLNAYPDRHYFQLVRQSVLVQQGVEACHWLATQPARDHARRDDALRDRYFTDKPQANADWPYKQGRTGLREEILTNAWWHLCRDVEDDHMDHSPIPEEQD